MNTDTLTRMMESAHAPFDFSGPYANVYRNRAMCIDERHVHTIFDVLMAGRFKSACELGSFDGASTVAFVEAHNRGNLERFIACDVMLSQSLSSVLANRNSPRVSYTNTKSWELLAREGDAFEYDCIFVDANHDLESVTKELDQILKRLPRCIMAHDTNATRMGYPAAEGAAHLADTIRKHPAYRGKCLEDAVVRDGEETHRGLFFATTDQELYGHARAIFAHRCPILEGVA